jgi:polyhydroxyalkanoate synthase
VSGSSKFLDPKRTLEQRRQAVVNLWDFLVRGGIADTTRTPGEVIDTGRVRRVTRYDALDGVPQRGLPVLLVPPLGSQSLCFDLRKGASVAEHMLQNGRPTYIVDYDDLTSADKGLGIEHWVNEVLPAAIAKVSEDNGGAEVDLVGWCMGGLLSICTHAAHAELPIHSLTLVASPFDMSKIPLMAPLRVIGKVSRGHILGSGLRAIGHIPSPAVSLVFKASALPTYIKKPVTVWKRRDDRDFLGQVQAVDLLMNNMVAYPGRATMQVYQRMAMRNEVATGRIQGPNKVVDLADVVVPVLAVGGLRDVLAPIPAVHHVGDLVVNSPDVRLATAPGGHLGVLTGTQARDTTWAYIDSFLDDHAPA